MAGVKGRSGGARPGAGRKPKVLAEMLAQKAAQDQKAAEKAAPNKAPPAPEEFPDAGTEVIAFLLGVMRNPGASESSRVTAAKTVLPFVAPKPGELGKKQVKQEAAKAAGKGRFGAGAPPKLVVNNR